MKQVYVTSNNKIIFKNIPQRLAYIKGGQVLVIDEHWITINGGEPDARHVLVKGGKAYYGGPKIGERVKKKIKTLFHKDQSHLISNEVYPKQLDVGGYENENRTVTLGSPMSHEQADSGNVNPGYESGLNKYDENCPSCAMAYELRRRGYNVEAMGYNEENDKHAWLNSKPELAWVDPETNKPPKKINIKGDADSISVELNSRIKDGERYHLLLNWPNDVSHVVVAEKDSNGKLRIYDPQKNEYKSLDDCMELVNKNDGIDLYRVDNAYINKDYAREAVKEHKDKRGR